MSVALLLAILLAVLVLPLVLRPVEENLKTFLLGMGILASRATGVRCTSGV